MLIWASVHDSDVFKQMPPDFECTCHSTVAYLSSNLCKLNYEQLVFQQPSRQAPMMIQINSGVKMHSQWHSKFSCACMPSLPSFGSAPQNPSNADANRRHSQCRNQREPSKSQRPQGTTVDRESAGQLSAVCEGIHIYSRHTCDIDRFGFFCSGGSHKGA